MKKITLLFLFSALAGFSQTTYQASDFANANEVFSVKTGGDFLQIDFTQTGPDYQWDYSSLTTEASSEISWLDPENTGYKLTWCFLNLYILNCNSQFSSAFNLANETNEGIDLSAFGVSNITSHYLKTEQGLENKMLGVTANLTGTDLTFTVDYSDPDKIYQFPMNYGDDYTDISAFSIDLEPLGFPVQMNSNATRHNQVEGWGSLQASGTFYPNVLKLKSTLSTSQIVTFQGQEIPLDVTTVTFSWFAPSEGVPVLQVSGTEVAGVFVPAAVTFVGESLNVTDETNPSEILLFPNPTEGLIHLSDGRTARSISVFNTLGQKVASNLDLTALRSGLYLVSVETEKGTVTQKIFRK